MKSFVLADWLILTQLAKNNETGFHWRMDHTSKVHPDEYYNILFFFNMIHVK